MRDRLVRQERADLAAGAAVALLPAPLRPAPVGLHRLRQPAPQERRHPAGVLHPRQLPARLHRQHSTASATSTARRSCCWCASRPTSRSRSSTSGSSGCGRTRRASTSIRSTAARSTCSRFVMDEDAGLPKVIEFMNAWARELPQPRAAPDRPLRGPARATPAGQLRRVLRVHGPAADRRPSSPTASPSPASRTCASSRRRAPSGSPARA